MLPKPVQSFRKTLIPESKAHLTNLTDINPMAKRRVPDDVSYNVYTEIKKAGAYRTFMKGCARLEATER